MASCGTSRRRSSRSSPGLYVEKGLSEELALEVAKQLTEHDALGAHAEAELGIDPDDITSPWNAALASMLAFTLGALLPLLTITLFGPTLRIWVTVVSVTVALALTGWGSARFGYGPPAPGRRSQRGRRAVRDGDHLRDRICARRARLGCS